MCKLYSVRNFVMRKVSRLFTEIVQLATLYFMYFLPKWYHFICILFALLNNHFVCEAFYWVCMDITIKNRLYVYWAFTSFFKAVIKNRNNSKIMVVDERLIMSIRILALIRNIIYRTTSTYIYIYVINNVIWAINGCIK